MDWKAPKYEKSFERIKDQERRREIAAGWDIPLGMRNKVAKLAKITPAGLSRILSGQNAPKDKTIKAIERALDKLEMGK